MKTIRIVGPTANKLWGICGLMMHSAICGASQKTMPYEGIVRSKLTAVSKLVNVQNEGRILSLVARIRNDCCLKFLSHSLNVNLKKSNLQGFSTLNLGNAQGIIGVRGFLKSRLVYWEISISKYHAFSLKFYFFLPLKKRREKPHSILKKMRADVQSISEDERVDSENITEETRPTTLNGIESETSSRKDLLETFVENDVINDVVSKKINSHDKLQKIINIYSQFREKNKLLHLHLSKIKEYKTALKNDMDDCVGVCKKLEQNVNSDIKFYYKKEEQRHYDINLWRNEIENEVFISFSNIKEKTNACFENSNEHKKFQDFNLSNLFCVFQEFNQEFTLLKVWMENQLIKTYDKAFFLHFFIKENALVEVQERLAPVLQEKQEEMELWKNERHLSKELCELSDRLLTLENIQPHHSMRDRFKEYLEIIVILKQYLNLDEWKNVKYSILSEKIDELFVFNNFSKRIKNFCNIIDNMWSERMIFTIPAIQNMQEVDENEADESKEERRKIGENSSIVANFQEELLEQRTKSMHRNRRKKSNDSFQSCQENTMNGHCHSHFSQESGVSTTSMRGRAGRRHSLSPQQRNQRKKNSGSSTSFQENTMNGHCHSHFSQESGVSTTSMRGRAGRRHSLPPQQHNQRKKNSGSSTSFQENTMNSHCHSHFSQENGVSTTSMRGRAGRRHSLSPQQRNQRKKNSGSSTSFQENTMNNHCHNHFSQESGVSTTSMRGRAGRRHSLPPQQRNRRKKSSGSSTSFQENTMNSHCHSHFSQGSNVPITPHYSSEEERQTLSPSHSQHRKKSNNSFQSFQAECLEGVNSMTPAIVIETPWLTSQKSDISPTSQEQHVKKAEISGFKKFKQFLNLRTSSWVFPLRKDKVQQK